MTTPLSHVGQTAHPEPAQQQQQGGHRQSQQHPHDAAPTQEPTLQSAQDAQEQLDEGGAGYPPQQQADFGQSVDERERKRQQRLVDSEDDPASDANTESANHPNDE